MLQAMLCNIVWLVCVSAGRTMDLVMRGLFGTNCACACACACATACARFVCCGYMRICQLHNIDICVHTYRCAISFGVSCDTEQLSAHQ